MLRLRSWDPSVPFHAARVCPRVTYTPGDERLAHYVGKEHDSDAEFEVERIVDERRDTNGSVWYLIKYMGYELNPEDWLGVDVEKELHNLQALDEWERLGPAKYRRSKK